MRVEKSRFNARKPPWARRNRGTLKWKGNQTSRNSRVLRKGNFRKFKDTQRRSGNRTRGEDPGNKQKRYNPYHKGEGQSVIGGWDKRRLESPLTGPENFSRSKAKRRLERL